MSSGHIPTHRARTYVSRRPPFLRQHLTISDMAREVEYLAPDLVVPCDQARDISDGGEMVCKAHILGVWVDTASFRFVPPLLRRRS